MGMIFLWCVGGALVTGFLAANKGRSIFGWLVLGAMFGIFATIVLAFLSPNTDGENFVKCPQCAEAIKAEAQVCKHCGNSLRMKNAA